MLAKCPSLLQKIRSSVGNLDEHATWYQWEHVEQMVQAKKGKIMKRVKKIQKVLKEGTVDDLLEDLEVQLPSFLEHVFVKRQQARFFKEKIEHLTEEEAVVQVDFAENYSCKCQGEVQSAHWSQDQVTLFTVAIWTKSGDKNSCCDSHVIVSDDLKHEKTSVAVFMCNVVKDLVKGRHPNITRVWIFSDGPSSQFKNRYIAHFLHLLQGQDDYSEEKGDFFSNASRNSDYTYREVSSESTKEDSESHDEEGDSSEEEGLTGNKGSGGPDVKERASNANKSSSDEEDMLEKKDLQVQQVTTLNIEVLMLSLGCVAFSKRSTAV